MAEGFSMPVYNTMGNHEIYGYAIEEDLDPDHPEYGEKMFKTGSGNATTPSITKAGIL